MKFDESILMFWTSGVFFSFLCHSEKKIQITASNLWRHVLYILGYTGHQGSNQSMLLVNMCNNGDRSNKGKRELVALLNLSSWCLVMVERLFLAVPQGCLRFVIVVFPDHTHLLFLLQNAAKNDARRNKHTSTSYLKKQISPTFSLTLFQLTVSEISFHHFCIICWLPA